MTKQERIDAIYEKIADKTLSFGCLLDHGFSESRLYRYTYLWQWYAWHEQMMFNRDNESYEYYPSLKIIWHPVMIWDVLDYIQSKDILKDWIWYILMYWKDKRKPIEDQPIECIEYIYNLLPNDSYKT